MWAYRRYPPHVMLQSQREIVPHCSIQHAGMGSNNLGSNNTGSFEWDDDDLDLDQGQITIYDDDGRSLDCFVEFSLTLQGQDYALLRPVDSPVEIFAVIAEDEEEETLVPLDDPEIDVVFNTAQVILEEQNLTLKRTALTLTVEGELPEVEQDDILNVEVESEEDTTFEEYQPLGCNFFCREQEYTVYTPMSPTLYVARLQPGQQPELLSPQDFQHIQPLLEEHLVEHFAHSNQEDDWE